MNAGVTVYCNDSGSIVLTPRDLRLAANFATGVQSDLWYWHRDDLIAVPEVELYCNQNTEEWDARICAGLTKHGRLWL